MAPMANAMVLVLVLVLVLAVGPTFIERVSVIAVSLNMAVGHAGYSGRAIAP